MKSVTYISIPNTFHRIHIIEAWSCGNRQLQNNDPCIISSTIFWFTFLFRKAFLPLHSPVKSQIFFTKLTAPPLEKLPYVATTTCKKKSRMLIAYTIWNNYYYKIQQVCLKLTAWVADWFQRFSEELFEQILPHWSSSVLCTGIDKSQTVYDGVQELTLVFCLALVACWKIQWWLSESSN